MDPLPNTRLKTLLRYTYRANMIFFAGFAAWYAIKRPDRPQESGTEGLQERRDGQPPQKQ